MRVTEGPKPDPNQNDPKLVVVKVKPVKRWPKPVTLAQIKADPAFQGWDLLRITRLSVVPVTPEQWRRLEELGH